MDTAFFTGNYVPRFSVEACEIDDGGADDWIVNGKERKERGGGSAGDL